MFDLTIQLEDKPGALAELGKILGNAGISIEGGGVFVADGKAIAHFLFEDGESTKKYLHDNGIGVLEVNEVLVQRLNQEQPGQLGKISSLMAEAGINIKVMYSDHKNQLILVVDNLEKGKMISDKWTEEQTLKISHSKAEASTNIIHIESNKLEWRPLIEEGIETSGIFIKTLRYDEKAKRSPVILLKFEAGAKYPAHNHPGGEEAFVIEGEVEFGNKHLTAGDYLYTPPGGKHAVWSKKGCLMFLNIPEEVEILKK